MNDSLIRAVQSIKLDAELSAVMFKSVNLRFGNWIGDWK